MLLNGDRSIDINEGNSELSPKEYPRSRCDPCPFPVRSRKLKICSALGKPAAAHDTEVERNLRAAEGDITPSGSFSNPLKLLSTGSQLRNAQNINAVDDGKGKGNVADPFRRPPLHGKRVVGDEPCHGSPDVCDLPDRTAAWNTVGGSGAGDCDNGAVEGGCEEARGKQQPLRQRLMRSDSDRAIFGRVDYNTVKRDLRCVACVCVKERGGGERERGERERYREVRWSILCSSTFDARLFSWSLFERQCPARFG